jgi:hypothetical protein
MHDHMMGPFWGNLIIVGIAGSITLACFLAMIRMLIRPGESDRTHPKHQILHDDLS